jgi:hypothetical protein
MTMLSDLESLVKLAEKATPGPWAESQYLDDGRWGVLGGHSKDAIVVGLTSRLTEGDVRLIAAAVNFVRNHVDELIDAAMQPGGND